MKRAGLALGLALVISLPALAGQQIDDSPVNARFALPLDCDVGQSCEIQNYVDRDPTPAWKDYLCGSASYNDHSGIDFRIPDMAAQSRGVNVLAAAAGRVTGIRDGVADISIKKIDRSSIAGRECGNGVVIDHGSGLQTQYCHMANGSLVVSPGTEVRAGQKLGQVGLSGNTEYPHLHFTVRRGQTIVDPFAPAAASRGTCGSGATLWRSEVARALQYKSGTVLNAGFASTGISMEQIEAGNIAAPTRDSRAVVAYVRAINLKAGDIQHFTLTGPDGSTLAAQIGPPILANQAQRFVFIGKPRPVGGWPSGRYRSEYTILRSGKMVLKRQFELQL